MTPEQREQLEIEQSVGRRAQASYEGYIKSFVEEKREILFENFRNLPLSAEAELMEVKRMLYAIDQLELEITEQIRTGQMASQALNEEETQH